MVKQAEKTSLKIALLIKEKFPKIPDKKCGELAKNLYIRSLKAFEKSLWSS